MTSCNDNQPLTSEAAFWALFSHPQMIADAMRGYARRPTGPLHPRTVDAMDFATLEKLPAEWIDDDFRRRQGDRIWRVRFRWARDWTDPDDYLLILVEFRSQPDPNIEQCIADYSQQLYEELHAADVVREEGPRPPIFPLVIYNGRQPWNMPIELGALAQSQRRGAATLFGASTPAWRASICRIGNSRQPYRRLTANGLLHVLHVLHVHAGDDRVGNLRWKTSAG